MQRKMMPVLVVLTSLTLLVLGGLWPTLAQSTLPQTRTGGPRPDASIMAGIRSAPAWHHLGLDGFAIMRIVSDPVTPGTIYVGTSTDGIYKTTDNGAHWSPKNSGLPSGAGVWDIAVDPVHPNIVYVLINNELYKSTDGAESWTYLTSASELGASRLALIVINPITPTVLYQSADSWMYKSIDGGEHWIGYYVGYVVYAYAMAISPSDPDVLYVGGATGYLYKSIDAGETWQRMCGTEPTLAINSVVVHPTNPDIAYIGAGAPNSVWRTRDGGASCQCVGRADQEFPRNMWTMVALDRDNPDIVYIGISGYQTTNGGVYQSLDAGDTWVRAGDALVDYESIISIAAAQEDPCILYAGSSGYGSTGGNGIWALTEDVAITGLAATNDSPTQLGQATTLTATVTAGSNVAYVWSLGDGDVGSGAVVTHTYPTIGVYTAVVTASNPVSVITATTTVIITDVPIAGLAAISDSPTPLGQTTTLTATVTAGTNVVYTWGFGDGSIGSGAVVTHTYPAVGVYTAVVTASNPVSLITATTTVTVTDVPIAGLAATNDSPTPLGQTTTLTATVTAGTNVVYTWGFGDGSIGSGAVVTHTYPTIGVYTAVVIASNPVSLITATTTVTITDLSIAGLAATNDSPTSLGQTTTLTATVTAGTNVVYTWGFGDGSIGSGAVVTHISPAVGVYTAVVTASNPVSLITATTTITITDVSTVYLPLIMHNHTPPITFPLHIGDAIPVRPVTYQGEIFCTRSVRIPGELPFGGHFHFSSESTAVAEVLVDDELAVLLRGAEVFAYDFSTSGTPVPAIVEVPRATMEQLAGQTVTIEYRDVYSYVVEASPMWLIWTP